MTSFIIMNGFTSAWLTGEVFQVSTSYLLSTFLDDPVKKNKEALTKFFKESHFRCRAKKKGFSSMSHQDDKTSTSFKGVCRATSLSMRNYFFILGNTRNYLSTHDNVDPL